MPGFNINGTGGELNSLTEVARSHRWRVSILGGVPQFDREITFGALSVQRPTPEFDQVKIHHKQTEIYFAGKHRWGAIDVVFYELINGQELNATSSEVFKLWAGSVVDLASNNLLDGYKRTLNIEQLSGGGLIPGAGELGIPVVYQYKCIGAWPAKVDPSELNYSVSEISTVKVNFRYDAVEEG